MVVAIAVAVASFALVGLLICVARFLFVHVIGFEARAADSAAAATAEEEAASMMRKLQRVTPVIVIQPNQEVHHNTPHKFAPALEDAAQHPGPHYIQGGLYEVEVVASACLPLAT